VEARTTDYKNRLALAEERVLSHSDKFAKSRLDNQSAESRGLTVLCSIHSLLGSKKRQCVLGILSQKEDAHYYLEDSTLSVRVAFNKLEQADPSCFFGENSIVLAEGVFESKVFYIQQLSLPPLHMNKTARFKNNVADYFGAYNYKSAHFDFQQAVSGEKEPSIVIISNLELDQHTTQKSMAGLFAGLEEMKPDIVVLVGDFISQQNIEREPFEKHKYYFETISQTVKESNLAYLRDECTWIVMPSISDPGQSKLYPCFKLTEALFSKGRLKSVRLATNPFRISYYGKEIVIARYNYFKKLKAGHLSQVNAVQQKELTEEALTMEDT